MQQQNPYLHQNYEVSIELQTLFWKKKYKKNNKKQKQKKNENCFSVRSAMRSIWDKQQ